MLSLSSTQRQLGSLWAWMVDAAGGRRNLPERRVPPLRRLQAVRSGARSMARPVTVRASNLEGASRAGADCTLAGCAYGESPCGTLFGG